MLGGHVAFWSGYYRMRGFRVRFQWCGANGSYEWLHLAETVGYLRVGRLDWLVHNRFYSPLFSFLDVYGRHYCNTYCNTYCKGAGTYSTSAATVTQCETGCS